MSRKKEEKTKSKWNTTVKLQLRQKEQIDKLKEDPTLNYKSVSDFVSQAVDKEIKEATLKSDLSDTGKIFFEDIFNHKRYEAFMEASRASRKPDHDNPFSLNEEKRQQALDRMDKDYLTVDTVLKQKKKKEKD